MNKLIEMTTFDFLEKVLDKSIEYSAKLTFNKKYQRHLYLVSLYGRIIELTHSCIILMKEKIISGVPIILRTLLETFADLRSLSDDENYVNFMQASYLKEWLRVFQEAKDGDNPYLGKISQIENLKQIYAEHEAKLQELERKGYAPLSHYNRFDKAEMKNEYRSIYNFLCSHTHSNIRSLYDRYTHITGDDFTVVFYKDPDPHDITLYSTTLCDLLISASLIIQRFFGSGFLSKVEHINAEWEEFKTILLTTAST
jgi:hypothetical protein